jgi:hypothetical protein
VQTNADLIGDFTSQEIQLHGDHRFVLKFSVDDPEIEEPSRHSSYTTIPGKIEDWISTVAEAQSAQSAVEFSDDDVGAGPSTIDSKRQAITMEKISREFACVECTERYPRAKMIIADCGDQCCVQCARKIFYQAITWKKYYPSRCCKQSMSRRLVTSPDHATSERLGMVALPDVQSDRRPSGWLRPHIVSDQVVILATSADLCQDEVGALNSTLSAV